MRKVWSAFMIMILFSGLTLLGTEKITARAAPKCETFRMFGLKVEYCPDDGTTSDIVKYENGQIVGVDSSYKSELAWRRIFDKYNWFVGAVYALASVTVLAIFIKQFLKLGASAGNPNDRAKAISGILWAGIGTALLGGAGILFMMFYNALG